MSIACATTRAAKISASSSNAPNVDVGDIVLLADNREAIVTARVEGGRARITALLEIVLSPFPPDTTARPR
jgi:hypothetical protein